MIKYSIPYINFMHNLQPHAIAKITGNSDYPLLNGFATFHEVSMGGVLVQVEVFHLPDDTLYHKSGFFGMHIHENGNCKIPFDKTGNHLNPYNTSHPEHVGDLPPLLSNNGYAWMAFLDSRFTISDILGKSLVIHSHRDDFTSQPAGDSGNKIGCGIISM